MLTDGVISLRPIEHSDLTFLRDLANDPAVRANIVGWDWPLSLSSQERWFDSGIETDQARRFVVSRTSDGRQLGVTGLWDIDWRNRTAMSAIKIGGSADARGHGYGSRSIQLMMAFAFEDVGLHRLYAQILEFNAASLALYRDTHGWTVEGRSRQHVWRGDRYCDLVHLGILRDEYLASRGAK